MSQLAAGGIAGAVSKTCTALARLTILFQILQSFPGLENTSENLTAHLFVGLTGGFLAAATTYPLDLVRTRLAAQLYSAINLVRRQMQLEGAGGRARVYNSDILSTLGHIIRSEGFRGLYRGILSEYYKVVPSVSIVFMTYEAMKQLLSSNPPAP